MFKKILSRQNFLILSWALYDTSNQFFVLNVISVYFPRWLTETKGVPTFYYSIAFAASMIFVALFAPILGTISDVQKRKKHYLVIFTLVSVIFTFLIGTIQNVFMGLVFFAIANFGCQLAVVFYNALLPYICSERSMGRVSGYGVAFGYLGSILGLIFVLPFVEGNIYGLEIPFITGGGSVSSFIPTAVLFFVFSLNIFNSCLNNSL